MLLRVRALLATAESSEFEGEVEAFLDKANQLAEQYELDPELLAFPREDLKLAVVMAERARVTKVLAAYEAADGTWATKTAEWSALLDEYDEILEVACDFLCLPLKRLPYGCRRHFRPPERARIESLIWDRLNTGNPGTAPSDRSESEASS